MMTAEQTNAETDKLSETLRQIITRHYCSHDAEDVGTNLLQNKGRTSLGSLADAKVLASI